MPFALPHGNTDHHAADVRLADGERVHPALSDLASPRKPQGQHLQDRDGVAVVDAAHDGLVRFHDRPANVAYPAHVQDHGSGQPNPRVAQDPLAERQGVSAQFFGTEGIAA